MSSPVVSATSGILYLQGIKSSGSYGALFTRLREVLPSEFTLETGIDFNVSYTPASTSAVYLSTIITTKSSWNDFFSTDVAYSEFKMRCCCLSHSGGAKNTLLYLQLR